jgi:hypothetical protein
MGSNKKAAAAEPAKAAKTTSTSTSTPAEPLAPPVQGSEEQYQRFLPDALAIPAAEIRPFRADAALAYQNALEGVKNVMAREAELAAQLPHEDLARLKNLPNVVLGLVFAVLHAEGAHEQPRAVRQQLGEARKLRRKLLAGFGALKEAGVFTQKEYDTIAAGRGPLDAANDCIALAAKFRSKWSAIANKTAITPEELARAAELGTTLQAEFKSDRVRISKAKKVGAAADAAEKRDRLWTLASRLNDRLWCVGTLIFGRAIDDYVPQLQTAQRKSTVDTRAATAQKAAERAVAKAQKAATKAQAAAEKKSKKKAKKAPA